MVNASSSAPRALDASRPAAAPPAATLDQLVAIHGRSYVDHLRSPDELLAEAQLRHAKPSPGEPHGPAFAEQTYAVLDAERGDAAGRDAALAACTAALGCAASSAGSSFASSPSPARGSRRGSGARALTLAVPEATVLDLASRLERSSRELSAAAHASALEAFAARNAPPGGADARAVACLGALRDGVRHGALGDLGPATTAARPPEAGGFLIARQRKDRGGALFRAGDLAAAQRCWRGALEILRDARADPDRLRPALHANLAELLLRRRNWGGAAQATAAPRRTRATGGAKGLPADLYADKEAKREEEEEDKEPEATAEEKVQRTFATLVEDALKTGTAEAMAVTEADLTEEDYARARRDAERAFREN
ncbi:hypothetical protein SO694_00106024 [Aureococcus anophagefferens]|uniref:Histone deacetylase domain-containing protein n=1 Tax=Aureococcus anophagefferens TaxID=44056 RepID=A0ABR1FMP8_AURAN